MLCLEYPGYKNFSTCLDCFSMNRKTWGRIQVTDRQGMVKAAHNPADRTVVRDSGFRPVERDKKTGFVVVGMVMGT